MQAGSWKYGADYWVVPVENAAVLFCTSDHRAFRISAELGDRLRSGFRSLTSAEASEWQQLEDSGVVSNVNASVLRSSSYADGANLAINVNLTGKCNLSCSYCFADGGDYGRIGNAMSRDLLPVIFEFIQRHHTRSKVVRFEVFGGEPLLNFPFIQELSRQCYRVTEETGIQFRFRISTNLTVLPPGAVELFAERKYVVSVSIDGGAETQNRNRPTKGGKASFDAIMRNCQLVRAGGDDITLVARMTVVGAEPPLIQNVRELWNLNIFDYFQIYPGINGAVTPADRLLKKDRKELANTGAIETTYLQQLSELMQVYPSLFGSSSRFRGILEFEQIADMILKGQLAVGHCGAGDTYFTFSPDGSINPCHRMVGDRSFEVDADRSGVSRPVEHWTQSVDDHPVCSGCWGRYVCGGNCRQENFVRTGDVRQVNAEACQYQLAMIEETLKRVVSADPNAKGRKRDLGNMFISCGRPVVANGRAEESQQREAAAFFMTI